MASFTALYTRPADVDGFERHYREAHLPMIDGIEGVSEVRVQRATGTPRGGEPPYHLLVEIVFADDAALRDALGSPAFRDLGKDAMDACRRFGVEATMLLGEAFA
jgi:uncharacterized protein (TIGR02118 family)